MNPKISVPFYFCFRHDVFFCLNLTAVKSYYRLLYSNESVHNKDRLRFHGEKALSQPFLAFHLFEV